MGGRAPAGSLTGGRGTIQYGEIARLTLETAEAALGVQEDVREEIRKLTYAVGILARKGAGLELTEPQRKWIEAFEG